MEKSVGGFGWSYEGEWGFNQDNGIRQPSDIDPDDIHSLFRVYALGDLGSRMHQLKIGSMIENEEGEYEDIGIMTQIERMTYEDAWPGVKVSRHEVNVFDGTTNSFKAEVLSQRIKCDIPTAQKLIETFRGLQLRSQDVDQLLKEGIDGRSFYEPADLPILFVKLVNLDMALPELPQNPTEQYTDEGYIRYRLGYTKGSYLIPEVVGEDEDEDQWPDPSEEDLTPMGTPNAFRSIPLGFYNQDKWLCEDCYNEIKQGRGLVRNPKLRASLRKSINKFEQVPPQEKPCHNCSYYDHFGKDPMTDEEFYMFSERDWDKTVICEYRLKEYEPDFVDNWYPKQKANYKALWRGIMNCTKHRDLELIGKAMHADPDMEKLDRVQQSMLWTRYSLQKSKLEHRTERFVEKMIGAVQKYPVTKKFRINGKMLTMGQLIFLYQKERRMNLSSAQWTKVWAAFKARRNNTFRPNCSELNF